MSDDERAAATERFSSLFAEFFAAPRESRGVTKHFRFNERKRFRWR